MPRSALASPRRGLARAVLAVAFAAAPLALASGAEPPGSGAEREAKVRAWVERNLRDWHWSLPPEDVERIVREAAERLRLGQSSQQIRDWVSAELNGVFYGFAKRGARHDDAVRYALPYDAKIPRLVSQGNGGKLTHHDGPNRYAFDFLMPIGAPVLAAREGVVARVEDGFALGDTAHANSVYVLHADGTFAVYTHLAPGSPVAEGRSVAVGEILGKSGDTGQDSGPHLHFAVARVEFDGSRKSLPIQFRLGAQDFVPKEKEFWGAPWRPTVRLRVSVDGKPADPAARVPLRRGDAAQLSVEALLHSGVQDMTAHAKTRFEPLTLWSVRVDRSGRVVAEPTPGFERARVDGDLVRMGTVGVFHGEPRERRRGFALVEFEILP
jgi:murein DD-endopeptidase MepM/ murein hydrolase activator NlpD